MDNLGKTLLDQRCFALETCDLKCAIDNNIIKNIVIYFTVRMLALKIK